MEWLKITLGNLVNKVKENELPTIIIVDSNRMAGVFLNTVITRNMEVKLIEVETTDKLIERISVKKNKKVLFLIHYSEVEHIFNNIVNIISLVILFSIIFYLLK